MRQINEHEGATERQLMLAALRANTLIFSVILGTFAGAALLAMALFAGNSEAHGGLAVALIGVFLPGYDSGTLGAAVGFLWGFAIGALLGGMIYRLNSMRISNGIEEFMVARSDNGEIAKAVLRLHGASLGVAVGAAGAIGLIATTNLLVVRGTAEESVHARLLSEILPGYTVSVGGSIVGALELFVVLYVVCCAFAVIYNLLAGRRRR